MKDINDDMRDAEIRLTALEMVVSRLAGELEKFAPGTRETMLSEVDKALGEATAEYGYLRTGKSIREAVRKILVGLNSEASSTQSRRGDD